MSTSEALLALFFGSVFSFMPMLSYVDRSPVVFLLQGAFLVAAVSSRPTTKLYGEITSPNYPKTYPNNNISTWDISVPKGYRVKLNFRLFDLEPSETCQYDFVKVCEEGLGCGDGNQGL